MVGMIPFRFPTSGNCPINMYEHLSRQTVDQRFLCDGVSLQIKAQSLNESFFSSTQSGLADKYIMLCPDFGSIIQKNTTCCPLNFVKRFEITYFSTYVCIFSIKYYAFLASNSMHFQHQIFTPKMSMRIIHKHWYQLTILYGRRACSMLQVQFGQHCRYTPIWNS